MVTLAVEELHCPSFIRSSSNIHLLEFLLSELQHSKDILSTGALTILCYPAAFTFQRLLLRILTSFSFIRFRYSAAFRHPILSTAAGIGSVHSLLLFFDHFWNLRPNDLILKLLQGLRNSIGILVINGEWDIKTLSFTTRKEWTIRS